MSSNPDMGPAIFNNDQEGRNQFLQLTSRVVQWIADYYGNIENLPVRSQVKPGEIYSQFASSPPSQPVSVDEVFRVVDEVILPGITHWQHPSFYAFFPGNTSFPSIAAELLTSGIAAQCMIWESSPVAAELEQRCMEWCRDLLGLPMEWSGVIMDTASTATLTALLTAREWKSGYRISKHGFDGTKYRIYASAQSHSSIEKAVRLAGFGTDNLVFIQVDENLSMIPAHLRESIENDVHQGYIPACVVSTLGTTATGAMDPVESVSEISGHYGLWHHVDAAYAGTALMLEENAHLRRGMEGVDSFVFNPHKWMFVQFDCTVYFIKDPELLIRAMTISPSYLKTMYGDEVNDYRDWGIPLGRRFRALKLWMTFQLLGADAIKERIRHHIQLAKRIEQLIEEDSRLTLAYPRQLNILTFHVDSAIDPDGDITRKLGHLINDSGKAYMTQAVVHKQCILRWVPAQAYVQEVHIMKTWEEIQTHLNALL